MSCVAKRVPVAGRQVFEAPAQQATFEPFDRGQASRKSYLYSNYPPHSSSEPPDSEEESERRRRRRHQQRLEEASGSHLEDDYKLQPAGLHESPVAATRNCAADGDGQQQQQQVSTFKCTPNHAGNQKRARNCDRKTRRLVLGQNLGPTTLTTGEERRNSLESMQSRLSTSSGANEAGGSSSPIASESLARAGAYVLATRYVKPPTIGEHQLTKRATDDKDDQLISVTNWHSIPLTDELELELEPSRPPGCERAEPEAQSGQHERLFGRLSSLMAGCKMLTGRAGDAKKQPTSAAGAQPAQENQPGQEGVPGGEESGPERRGTGKGGRPNSGALNGVRRTSSGIGGAGGGGPKSVESRKGSLISFKSVGSGGGRTGEQIGKKRAPFLFAGILASILGSIFFSMSMLTIKLLPDDHGLVEKTKIVFIRGCVLMLMCSVTILHQKSTFKIRRDEIWLNILRSVFGFVGVYGAYISLKYISMGDSTALVFSSPVWTSLLSHFILNEPLQWIQLVALPASLVGIVLIAHPALLINMDHLAGPIEKQPLLEVADVVEVGDLLPLLNETGSAPTSLSNATSSAISSGFSGPALLANLTQTLNRDLDTSVSSQHQFDSEHRWKGIAVALATSFIVSFVYIVLKFRKSTPIQTTTFWLGVTTVLFSFATMCFIGFGQMPRTCLEWSLLLINGVCSWIGQVLLQWALCYEDASVLSVVRTLDVAMTFTLSALFLHEEILWTSVLGAAIIAFVVVSIMINSWLTKRLCPSTTSATNGAELAQCCAEHELPCECHADCLRTGAGHATPFKRRSQQWDEKSPPGAEITLKLEAPSVRKLRDNEAAA